MPTPSLAYSYIRFSTAEQAKGDSLRRQMKAAGDWCEGNGVTLDTSTTLHDLGRSAFLGEHRKNPDRNALAAFLKLVEEGKIPRGSFLLLESLDRLSREHIRPALTLLLNLIESGIRVVQLIPVVTIYDDQVEPMALMMAIMELSRGHAESAVKSERVGAAWGSKKARARSGEHIITHKLPGWVKDTGGKLELVPEAASAVRRVYELTRAGYGNATIAKKLNAEGVTAIGTSGAWARSYISKILSDRRAIGEFQPRKRDGSPDGDPIPDYFPAVVTEEEWFAARAAATGRRRPGSTAAPATGGSHNLFAGLVTDARDSGSYYAAQRVDGKRRHWALVNTRSVEGHTRCVSFPLEVFERCVLSLLREIDPHALLGSEGPVSPVTALAAELGLVEADIGRLETELETGGESIPAVVRVLGKKEARRKELADALAAARAKEATPVTAAWGEYRTLCDVLDKTQDREEIRVRLRAALRRIVSGIWLLAVGRGRMRLAVVTVAFRGSEGYRDYIIVYSPPKSNGKSNTPSWTLVDSCRSRTPVGVMLDLRDPQQVIAAEEMLMRLDLDECRTEAAK